VWTTVLLGNSDFPSLIAKRTLTYKTGQFLNSQEYPKLAENLRGGLIIKLPLTDIRQELES
jgi:hypothetical protein